MKNCTFENRKFTKRLHTNSSVENLGRPRISSFAKLETDDDHVSGFVIRHTLLAVTLVFFLTVSIRSSFSF